jgi:hypothetical protein
LNETPHLMSTRLRFFKAHSKLPYATKPPGVRPFLCELISDHEIGATPIAATERSDTAALSGSVAWTVPPQASAGSQFTIDASGRIDLIPDPPDHTDEAQRELYDEVRLKARELSNVGDNQLGDLAGPANLFLAALPERLEDASIVRLWSRGNTLRLRLAAHGADAFVAMWKHMKLPVPLELSQRRPPRRRLPGFRSFS